MDDVAGGQLSGVRRGCAGSAGYAAHPGLAAANGQLLEYAKNGGVVIVQYNLGEFRLWAVSVLAGKRGEGGG